MVALVVVLVSDAFHSVQSPQVAVPVSEQVRSVVYVQTRYCTS